MPKKGDHKPLSGDPSDPHGLIVWMRRYLEHLAVKGQTKATVRTAEACLRVFIDWAFVRGVVQPTEVTKPIVEAFQRHLFYYRQANGKPLTFASQRMRLQKLRSFFRWLARQNVILWNPTSDIELPRTERRLPRAVFTETDVEKVLAVPDTTCPLGLRDRAILEVFYATGIRRVELAALHLVDVDAERGTLGVRQGKGRVDRMVPIGERALHWLGRYLDEARPELAMPPDEGIVFLSDMGEPLKLPRLTHLARDYIEAAKIGKSGACHVFRHTMATLMLEGGADVRLIQAILGHASLSTTQIYTRVSIKHLKVVYDQTHPGAKLERRTRAESPSSLAASADGAAPATEAELLAALEREAREEDGEPTTE